MIYLNQNMSATDRQKVRENCNLFIRFNQKGRSTMAIYHDFFNRADFSYDDFINICEKVWEEPYSHIVIDKSKNRNINGKLRINWRVL